MPYESILRKARWGTKSSGRRPQEGSDVDRRRRPALPRPRLSPEKLSSGSAGGRRLHEGPQEDSDIHSCRAISFRSEQPNLRTPTLPNGDEGDPQRRRPANHWHKHLPRGDDATPRRTTNLTAGRSRPPSPPWPPHPPRPWAAPPAVLPTLPERDRARARDAAPHNARPCAPQTQRPAAAPALRCTARHAAKTRPRSGPDGPHRPPPSTAAPRPRTATTRRPLPEAPPRLPSISSPAARRRARHPLSRPSELPLTRGRGREEAAPPPPSPGCARL
nr:uncharacterized protein LOC127310253 [Lolium perenne]